MTASAQRAAEPSMEEILASIRRIIADDQSRSRMTTKLAPLPGPGDDKPALGDTLEEGVGHHEAPEEASPAAPAETGGGAIVDAEPVTMTGEEEAHLDQAIDAEPSLASAEPEESIAARMRAGQGAAQSRQVARDPAGAASVSMTELAPVAKLEAEVAKLVQDTFAQEGFGPEGFVQDRQGRDPVMREDLREDPPEEAEEAAMAERLPEAAPPESDYTTSAPQPAPTRPSAAANGASARRQTPQPGPMTAPAQQPVGAAAGRRDLRSSEPREARAGTRPETRDRDPLLSSETDIAVARAFSTLSRTVLSDNARTLEDLVTEMLRPLLKAWLDDNLPSLVERLVRMEIERVARGRPAD